MLLTWSDVTGLNVNVATYRHQKENFAMPATRLYVADSLTIGNSVELAAEQARYVGRVLRKKTGDRIVLFDGSGGEYDASIAFFRKDAVGLIVEKFRDVRPESKLAIRLLQCVSRGERMDIVVQKATELGVSRITPITSEYSVVKFDEKRAGKRVVHWQKVAIGACEQSGRTLVPDIDRPMRLRDVLGDCVNADWLRLICKPGTERSAQATVENGQRIDLLVGPEGGFSEDEYALADAAGFVPLGLGPRILRTETAAIVALTILQHRLGDMC